MNHHIGFIGGGNMAQAIITGLLKSGRAASDILVSDPNPESRRAISALGVAAFDHHEPVMAQAEFMILAVKPQMMDAVLAEIAPSLRESQIVISIAAYHDWRYPSAPQCGQKHCGPCHAEHARTHR